MDLWDIKGRLEEEMTYPKYKNKHLEEALWGPSDLFKYNKSKLKLPKKFVMIYSVKALKCFIRKYKPKEIKYSPVMDIYVHENIGIFKMPGIGCPVAATVIEELVAHGGKEFISVGVAGGLNTDGFFLCKKALRDEGTSYHYLPHGDYTFPDDKLTNKLGKIMKKNNLEYEDGITWTIDAPYRETKAEVKKYAKMGIKTVEMEASALFAVAKFRKVKVASAFVVSDVLGKKWEPRFNRKDTQKNLNKLVDAAVECLGG